MDEAAMIELIDRHLAAEATGDIDGAIAVYTDDVEHDVVGFPGGPLHGKEAARGFYEYLSANVADETFTELRRFPGDDVCVVEHLARGTVTGEFLGLPGNGRTVEFRMLHVFEFRDGLISRENTWTDGGAVAAQLGGG